MKFSVSVKSDDSDWKRMMRNLSRGGDKAVNVGWWNTMHPSGIPVAQVAQLNDAGHLNGATSAIPGSRTPPRPFMRVGFVPKIKDILPSFVSMAHQVAMGRRSWADVNAQLGFKLKTILQEVIEAWNTPPNSPVTVSLKGFNDPLIHTGTMLDTIQTKVVRKGGQA